MASPPPQPPAAIAIGTAPGAKADAPILGLGAKTPIDDVDVDPLIALAEQALAPMPHPVLLKSISTRNTDLPLFLQLPREIMLLIVRFNLGPEDLHQLSLVSSSLRLFLRDLRGALFEDLIDSRFTPDIVAAYRSGQSPFHQLDQTAGSIGTAQPWGPAVLSVCFPTASQGNLTPGQGTPERKASAKRDSKVMVHRAQAASLDIARHPTTSRRTYHDLARFTLWLAGKDAIVNGVMKRFLLIVQRRMELVLLQQNGTNPPAPAEDGSGVFVLGRGWESAAAFVHYRRRRLDFEPESETALKKLVETLGRLKVLSLRAVLLIFALILGCKRDCFDKQDSSDSFDNYVGRSQTANLTVRMSSPERRPSRAGAVEERTASESGPLSTSPASPVSMALVHVPSSHHRDSSLPAASRLHALHWRRLRLLESDGLTALAVAIFTTRTLLVDALVGPAAAAVANANPPGLSADEAGAIALQVLTTGSPGLVRSVLELGRATDVASHRARVDQLLQANPRMRPEGGPFLLNAVIGVLKERGIAVEDLR